RYWHDHVPCVPEWRLTATATLVKAISPGVSKTVGSANDGSNPSPATTCGNGPWPGHTGGCGPSWCCRTVCQDVPPCAAAVQWLRTYGGENRGRAGGSPNRVRWSSRGL